MRYEGLDKTDIEYLTTPLSMLDKEGLQIAISVYDKHVNLIAERNKTHVRKSYGYAYVISDDLGTHGIKSMADGKQYDSKSKYRSALKSQGYVEMGSDAPIERKSSVDGDFVTKREIAETMERLGV